MPFSPKNWEDEPTHTTPISAAALEDLETRLSTYSDDVGDSTLTAALAADNGPTTITVQTGDYTLALTDAQTKVEVNAATAKTVTVPTNASVAFPTGTTIEVAQVGAGAVTIAAAGGVSLTAPFGLTTGYQGSSLYLIKEATNSWTVINGGQLVSQGARVSGSNFTRTTATLADITGLSIPVGANEVWEFSANLSGTCTLAAGAGVKFAVNGPSGATVEATGLFNNSSNTTHRSQRLNALNTPTVAVWTTTATDYYGRINGLMTVSSTAGNLTIQGEPNTAADTLTVYIGSTLKGQRLA